MMYPVKSVDSHVEHVTKHVSSMSALMLHSLD